MADFKVPNLCGASPEFNAIQTKFESMMTSAIDGLEVDASALKATLDTNVTALVADLKAMIPELPALPDINLQAQLTSLSSLIPGTGQYKRLLSDITTKFGSELTANGFSLDTLVSDAVTAITEGTNLCSAVPNFTVPESGGDAVEKAVEVLQPAVDSLPEKVSTLLANANFTAAKTAVEAIFTSYEEIGEEVPDESIGPYRVAESTEISVSDNKGNVTKKKVVTSKSASKTEERKNVAPEGSGFTRKKVWKQELFKSGDVVMSPLGYHYRTDKVVIKEEPIEVAVTGHDPKTNTWNLVMDLSVMAADPYWTKEKAVKSMKGVIDYFEKDGKNIIIHNDFHTFGAFDSTKGNKYKLALPKWEGVEYAVTYAYYDNYDADFAAVGPTE
jgi:uncharacterized protein YoxC